MAVSVVVVVAVAVTVAVVAVVVVDVNRRIFIVVARIPRGIFWSTFGRQLLEICLLNSMLQLKVGEEEGEGLPLLLSSINPFIPPASTFLRQVFETDYPKLMRVFSDLISRLEKFGSPGPQSASVYGRSRELEEGKKDANRYAQPDGELCQKNCPKNVLCARSVVRGTIA